MVKITFIQPDGSEQTVEAEPGMTVMETAKKAMIDGIEAECGGACACATCHVYVDDAWRDKVGARSAMEEDMLDFAFEVKEFEPAQLPDQSETRARRVGCTRTGKAILRPAASTVAAGGRARN